MVFGISRSRGTRSATPQAGEASTPARARRNAAPATQASTIALATRRSAANTDPNADANAARRNPPPAEAGNALARLATLRERGAQAVYDHGFGVHQTTTALLPVTTTTASARPRLRSTVRGEGQPAPTVPRSISNASRAAPRGRSPEAILQASTAGEAVPEREAQQLVARLVERQFAKSSPADRRALVAAIVAAGRAAGSSIGEMRELAACLGARHQKARGAARALQVVVDRQRLLGALESPQAVATALERDFSTSPPDDRLALGEAIAQASTAAGLSPAETGLLAEQLGVCFERAGDANRALQGLASLNLPGDIVRARATDATGQLAWTLAADLQATPGVGLDLLDKLSDRAPDDGASGPRRAPLDTDQRGALRAYLLAAGEVRRGAPAAARPALDPHSIYAHGKLARSIAAARQADPAAWPGRAGAPTPAAVKLTLAEKALLAVHDQLDPSITAVHGCRYAVEMVRGGMLTDAKKDRDNQPSEFFQVESRAAKTMGPHLDRAIGLRGGQRVKAALTRPLLHQGKSPFFAVDTVLAGQHPHMQFALAHHGATNEARLIADDMFGLIDEALRRSGGADGQPLPTPTHPADAAQIAQEADTLRGLLRCALMREMKTDPVFLPRLTTAPEIPPRVMEAACEQVRAAIRFDPGDSAATQALEAALAEIANEHADARLTPQRLRDWASDAGAPWARAGEPGAAEAAAEPAPGALGQEEWAPFARAYARLAQGERPAVAVRPIKGSTRAEVAQMLEEMINGLELIGGFSLSNAGNTNGTTKNVSEVVSGILSAGAAVLRLDVGGGRVREVLFEAGTSTDRMALRMSVATLQRVQAGAGGSAGFHLGDTSVASAGIGVGADAGYAYELAHQEGAVFGFPRHRSGGVNGDKALYAKLGKLAKLLIDGEMPGEHFTLPGNPEDRGSLVKRAYQHFGSEISVGRFTVEQAEHKTTLGVSGGPSVTAGHFKLGLAPISASKQWRRGHYVYRDHSGALRVHKQMQPRTSKWTVGGSLASLNGLVDTLAPTEVAGHTLSASTQLGAGPLASASMDIQAKGASDSTIHIQYDGKTLPTSFATTTYARPKEWNEDLGENLETYARDKAIKYRPARYAADPEGTVEEEQRYLAEYAGRVGAERDLTTSFQKYDEFPEHTGKMDLLDARAGLADRRGDAQLREEAGGAVQDMLTDPDCRGYRFAIAIHTQTASVAKGPNGVMGLTHTLADSVTQKSGDFT